MTPDPFADPDRVARYFADTPRRVPGYTDLHHMALNLLSERAATGACILVLGAGGGLELRAFARARPDWSFVGVDPSQPMLDLAAKILEPEGAQVELINGRIGEAPFWPFDGATCLLTLHFLSIPERLEVLRGLRARLAPGAPVIVAHHCAPETGAAKDWLARSAAFAAGPDDDPQAAIKSADTMAQQLTLLTPDVEQMLLRDAGFVAPSLFYAALSFRGWVAYAGAL